MPFLNLRELGKVGGNLATIGGAAVAGYGEDKADALKELLTQNAERRAQAKSDLDAKLGLKTLNTLHEGEVGFGTRKADDIRAESPAEAQAAADKITATAKPLADAKLLELNTTAPGEALKAGAIAQAEVAPHVKQAVDIATESPQAASGTVLPGTPGHPAQVVVTGGRDSKHPIGTTIAVPDVVPKGPGGGGASAVVAQRAQAAIPQIDTALKNFDQYHEPGAAGRLFARSPLGGWAISDEGQNANQAADAIATAYAGAKTRSGNATPAIIHEYANQIKIQPGEGDNPSLVAAKVARAHAWRDELAQLAGSSGGAAIPDHSKMSDAEFAAAYRAGAFKKH